MNGDDMNEKNGTVLIVLHAFGTHAKGEIISDPTEIAAIRADGRMSHVVETRAPDQAATGKGE